MNKITLFGLNILLLSAMSLYADKPSWAGNGGKPSDYEKKEHKNEMTSKHEEKKEYRKEHDEDGENHREVQYGGGKTYPNSYPQKYEGQGKTDGEFIEEKVDETKKNWIGKFFDFLN